MDDAAPGPASLAALREAVRNGREPPPARIVAGFKSYRWFVVGTVCVGAFMGQVDSSIAQMLLPRLELEFDARLSTVSWVAVAYLLAMAAFLPIFGRLADMVGRKLLYTGGFLLFVLSSALCGLAPSLPVLIAFRIAQGIGAALLSSNSVAIVVTAAGPAQRGRALGVLSAAQAVGLSAGPALGGLVLDLLDWRWVFWINVPVGLAGTVLGWFVLPPTQDLPADSRFDWKGAFLIAPALTRSHAVPAKRLLRRQLRRAHGLRGAVRPVLFDALHLRARLPGFDFGRGSAPFHRPGDACGCGADCRCALRPARRPFAHRIGHAHLRRGIGVALRRAGRRARKPAARDARARDFRNRARLVHLAQQQRGRGRRAGGSDRGSRRTAERNALLRHQYRRRGRVLAARLAARAPHRLRPRHAPRRSAAAVGGGPRRHRPARGPAMQKTHRPKR